MVCVILGKRYGCTSFTFGVAHLQSKSEIVRNPLYFDELVLVVKNIISFYIPIRVQLYCQSKLSRRLQC